MGQLDGRVAIVTGSGRGIGQQIALRLARDGARIVVNDLDEAPALETIALVRQAGSEAVACNGDVAAPDFGERVVKTALDASPRWRKTGTASARPCNYSHTPVNIWVRRNGRTWACGCKP
jgi:NAD(P)-dependent dehydrogenase (short-subunit alcohol dehydrogenase family)